MNSLPYPLNLEFPDCTNISKSGFWMGVNESQSLDRRRYTGVIYPGGEIRVVALGEPVFKPFEEMPDEMAIGWLIHNNFVFLYVLARADYTDVFGRRHTTRYCARWVPPDQLYPCYSGNYAD